MAWAFPLTRPQFMDLLPIRSLTMDVPEAVEISETGGGELLQADLGTRLWSGEIVLGRLLPDEAGDALAMLAVARSSTGSVLIHDLSRPGPRLDPDGSILGAAAVTLADVNTNARNIQLAGLPVGYGLRRGDMLGFSYGSNPVRRALHRVASTATAAGDGTTNYFEVTPPIRPGWAAGTAVTLIRPECKAVILPGTFQPGRRAATLTDGVSFKFRQTLR